MSRIKTNIRKAKATSIASGGALRARFVSARCTNRSEAVKACKKLGVRLGKNNQVFTNTTNQYVGEWFKYSKNLMMLSEYL